MPKEKGFREHIVDAIDGLKKSPEYNPGKEVVILIPVNTKHSVPKDIPLDNIKSRYIEQSSYGAKMICEIKGNIR